MQQRKSARGGGLFSQLFVSVHYNSSDSLVGAQRINRIAANAELLLFVFAAPCLLLVRNVEMRLLLIHGTLRIAPNVSGSGILQ